MSEDQLNEAYEDSINMACAYDRVDEIEELRLNNDWGFDEVEAHCIAVLDSEFMLYPQDLLENILSDYLDNVYVSIQEDCV